MTKLSIAVALAEDSMGIGLQGKLPWHIPGEIKYFKQLTSHTQSTAKSNAVVMGRKTWESIPKKFRPLSNRLNVVISTQPAEKIISEEEKNVEVFDSLEKAMESLSLMSKLEKIFLIGGSSLYHQALRKNLVQEMYVTEVKGKYAVDCFFPLVDLEGEGKFVKVNNDFLKPEGEHSVEGCSFYKYILRGETGKAQNIPHLQETEEKENDENVNQMNVNISAGKNQKLSELEEIKQEISLNYTKHEEYQYLKLVLDVIVEGNKKMDRTKVGTHSLFGRTMRFSLANDIFPLLTTKNTFFRGVAEELLFFISGKTDNKLLQEKKIHIWDLNCSRQALDNLGLKDREENDLGPVYGFQWRHFGAEYSDFNKDYTSQGVDQLKSLVERIKSNPNCRRLILSAWNVKDLPQMVLPPCHMFAQFYVHDNKLSCQMYQRSADLGLGVPFNIASYALLTRMIAQCCGLEAHEFVHVIGDCHVYNNHVEQLMEQLKRKPRDFPRLKINPEKTDIDSFEFSDFTVEGYKPHKKIKMQMAV